MEPQWWLARLDDDDAAPVAAPLAAVIGELRQAWARDLEDLPKDAPSDGSWEEFVNELRAEMASASVTPAAVDDVRTQASEVTMQEYEHDCVRSAQVRPTGGKQELGSFLDELQLPHVKDTLSELTLLECVIGIEDRPALLRRIQECGVSKLPERQKIANTLSRCRREGGWLERPVVSEAAVQPTRLVAPSLEPCVGTGGLLFAPSGRCHYLGNGRPEGASRHLSLSGPVLQSVARLAGLSGRPVFVAHGASDPFVLQTGNGGFQTALDAPKLEVYQRAFGPELLVLAAAVPRTSGPSASCVMPLPPFDSWAEVKDELPVAVRPFRHRKAQAVWRGSMRSQATVGTALVTLPPPPLPSLRAQLVAFCEGKSAFDVAFASKAGRSEPGSRWLTRKQQRGEISINRASPLFAPCALQLCPPYHVQNVEACRLVVFLLFHGLTANPAITEYRVLLVVDSDRIAGSWVWALASGCVIVAVGQWTLAIPELRPWEHFVPASADLSDLESRVEWALNHPEVAQRARALFTKLRTPEFTKNALVSIFSRRPCNNDERRSGVHSLISSRSLALPAKLDVPRTRLRMSLKAHQWQQSSTNLLPPTHCLVRFGDAPTANAEAWARIIHESGERSTPAEATAQFEKEFAPWLHSEIGRRMYFVLDASGVAMGTATAWFEVDETGAVGPTGRVHWVALVPSAQGQGLAKPLLRAVLTRLRELHGPSAIVLTTHCQAARAICMYREMGFVPSPLAAVYTAEERDGWEGLEKRGVVCMAQEAIVSAV